MVEGRVKAQAAQEGTQEHRHVGPQAARRVCGVFYASHLLEGTKKDAKACHLQEANLMPRITCPTSCKL